MGVARARRFCWRSVPTRHQGTTIGTSGKALILVKTPQGGTLSNSQATTNWWAGRRSPCQLSWHTRNLHEKWNHFLERRFWESLVERQWAHDYLRHPVVVAESPSERVWPLALCLDGVSFLKRDGLLGLTMYNLCSGERHLLLIVRRSDLCRCGCQG